MEVARKPDEASRQAAIGTFEETCYCLRKKKLENCGGTKVCPTGGGYPHANHASQSGGYKTTAIVSEDTDVMILCLGHCKNISGTMYLKSGTHNRTKYINMSSLAEHHGAMLLRVHAFTGDNSVSAFAGQGKLNALKIVKMNRTFQ